MSNQIEAVPHQPDRGISQFFRRKNEHSDRELVELTSKVVRKLVQGVSESGTASVFRTKASGAFEEAILNGYFTSKKIPRLHVMIWKDDIRPSDESLESHRKFFGVTHPKIFISAVEYGTNHSGRRAIDVVQRWDMGPDEWEIIYRRDAIKEASNLPASRSNREKIKFLRQILETEIDTQACEQDFGRPYVPGDTWSNDKSDDITSHRKHWMRDIRHLLFSSLLPSPEEFTTRDGQMLLDDHT